MIFRSLRIKSHNRSRKWRNFVNNFGTRGSISYGSERKKRKTMKRETNSAHRYLIWKTRKIKLGITVRRDRENFYVKWLLQVRLRLVGLCICGCGRGCNYSLLIFQIRSTYKFVLYRGCQIILPPRSWTCMGTEECAQVIFLIM